MYRKLFILGNVALMATFVLAFVLDYNAEWKTYQKSYYKMAADAMDKQAQAQSDPEKASLLKKEAAKMRKAPVEIKQILAKDLDRVDRCITCHVGMDEYTNPTMTNEFAQNPYKAHPKLDLLNKNHPFSKYGCTVCHEGQGLATTVDAGHGKVKHWEKPLLEGKLIQASCARCHADTEGLQGAEVVNKGRMLYRKHGCQGCHSVDGFGQIVSVSHDDMADKPLERIAGFNFSQIKKDGKPLPEEEWTLQNWILGHLTNDPMAVTPNDPHAEFNAEPVAPSGMPDFTEADATGKREMSEDDAHAITAYLLAQTAESLPHRYYVPSGPRREPSFSDPAAHGKFVFEKYGCAGCHGLGGAKGRRNYNALGPGQDDPKNDMDKGREPTLVDVVGTYTKEELMKKISDGVPSSAVSRYNPEGPVPPLYMPAWKDRIKGRELEDLATYLLSIAKKQDVGF